MVPALALPERDLLVMVATAVLLIIPEASAAALEDAVPAAVAAAVVVVQLWEAVLLGAAQISLVLRILLMDMANTLLAAHPAAAAWEATQEAAG